MAEPDATIEVLVRPRAARDEVAGEHAGAIVIRVTAPPADGRANAAVRKLIAKRAGVAAGRVEIVRGQAARQKLVRVRGIEPGRLRSALLGYGTRQRPIRR
ncbi:MAG: DUF167 domain-containing protein [Solirubrobacterales bacterium]|nr:DUF167 domain-containing protein [Solirubrobacterales bacterium]